MSSLEGIAPETPAREVAKLFEDRDLVSAPVVSRDGKLLGRITIDDVVDVIREEADHSVMSMAGLTEDEDMFAGVLHQCAAPRDLAVASTSRPRSSPRTSSGCSKRRSRKSSRWPC